MPFEFFVEFFVKWIHANNHSRDSFSFPFSSSLFVPYYFFFVRRSWRLLFTITYKWSRNFFCPVNFNRLDIMRVFLSLKYCSLPPHPFIPFTLIMMMRSWHHGLCLCVSSSLTHITVLSIFHTLFMSCCISFTCVSVSRTTCHVFILHSWCNCTWIFSCFYPHLPSI